MDESAGGDRTRVRRVAAVAGLTVLLALGALGLAVRSRAAFGTFRFWDYPARIDYCGRRYYAAADVQVPSTARLSASVDGPTTWKTVARTLTLRRIEGPIRPPGGRSSVCAMTLYISAGEHRYRVYELSGGP